MVVASHPLRVRGLKRVLRSIPAEIVLSHPLRVRGLKRYGPDGVLFKQLSHPLRVRGLKPAGVGVTVTDIGVAPFTGAWIETRLGTDSAVRRPVAPFTGAWIETSGSKSVWQSMNCRTLYGCVD